MEETMKLRWMAALTACAWMVSCGTGGSMSNYHLGDWEKDIGYSQSVRVGQRILVSGTVGDEAHTALAQQMADAYEALKTTLAHDGATLKQVIKETIYTTDMDALIAAQELRKGFYGENLPASTWVQVQRLYSAGHLIEIEVEAWLP